MPQDNTKNPERGFLKLFLAFWNKMGILVVFLLVCLILAILTPNFRQPLNIVNVVRQVSIIGVAAVGMTMVILLGLIDLSVGSIIAFAGISCAWVQMNYLKGANDVLVVAGAVVVALVAGSLVGFFNGFISTKGRIHPFIITLGTMSIFRGVTMFIGKGRPISGMSGAFRYIGAGELGRGVLPFSLIVPFPVIIFLLVVLIFWFVLVKTPFGRSIYAIGGNQEAAYLSGIMVDRVKIMTFTILGTLCGLSALILTSRLNSAEAVAGQGYELDVITAVIIGGTSLLGGEGSIPGTLVGVLLIGVIQNGLNLLMVQPYWQLVIKGLIIIIALLMDRLKRVFQED
jgi:ribose/xylose/arabinose/galactoside ABC-type transport system permease subunit